MESVKVLVAEHEPELRAQLRLDLQLLGYLVADAWDGQHALQVLREEPPDVLLLDLAITGVGSIAILAEMRVLGLLRRTRVLLLANRDGVSTARETLGLGVSDILRKPLRAREVKRGIERLFSSIPRMPAPPALDAFLMSNRPRLTPF